MHLGGLQVLRLLGQLAVSRLHWPATRAGTTLVLEARAPAALLRICVLNSQLSHRPGVLCAVCDRPRCSAELWEPDKACGPFVNAPWSTCSPCFQRRQACRMIKPLTLSHDQPADEVTCSSDSRDR